MQKSAVFSSAAGSFTKSRLFCSNIRWNGPPKIEETIDADFAVYLNSLQPPRWETHLVYGAHLVRLILSTLGLLPVRVYIYSANQSQLREIP